MGLEVGDLLCLILRTEDQGSGGGCLMSLSSPIPTVQVSDPSSRTIGRCPLLSPARIPARAPRAGAAAQQRGRLARGRLIRTARRGAGARGHEEALGTLLAAAPAQTLRALRPPSTAQLAQQTLRHHLVEARPMLLGDKDPAKRGPQSQTWALTTFQRRLLVALLSLPGVTREIFTLSPCIPSWCRSGHMMA